MNPKVKIDRNSPIPLYYQLKTHLLELIQSDALSTGSKLPPEEEIISETGLSRFTVRQAMQELEREGLIVRIRGKGTYVTESNEPVSVDWDLLSFSEDMALRGHDVQSSMIEIMLLPVPFETAQALEIKVGTPVVFFKRLRTVDGEPYLVDLVNLRADYCPGLEKEDLTNRSLYDLIEKKYGVRIVKATRTVNIRPTQAWIAKCLGIKTGTECFTLTDVGYTPDGSPVQYARSFVNRNVSEFVFFMNLTGDMGRAKKLVAKHAAHPMPTKLSITDE